MRSGRNRRLSRPRRAQLSQRLSRQSYLLDQHRRRRSRTWSDCRHPKRQRARRGLPKRKLRPKGQRGDSRANVLAQGRSPRVGRIRIPTANRHRPTMHTLHTKCTGRSTRPKPVGVMDGTEGGDTIRSNSRADRKRVDQSGGKLATGSLSADHLTVADIPLGCVAYRWYVLPIERPELPHLRAWYEQLTKRPGFCPERDASAHLTDYPALVSPARHSSGCARIQSA
jgi:hypothetical protein